MKLSIVIPVYNVEKYIERCLNSIFNLNLENEIILIDDGSTDRSLEIIEKIKENNINENIKIIRQSNQGPSEARNKGIEIAEGEYISSIMTVTDVKKYIDAIKFYDIILDYVSDGNFSEEFYNATTSLMSKSFDWTISDTLNTSKSENMEKVFLEFRHVFRKHREIIKNNTSKRIYKNYKLINFNYKLYIFIYLLKNKWRRIRRKR